MFDDKNLENVSSFPLIYRREKYFFRKIQQKLQFINQWITKAFCIKIAHNFIKMFDMKETLLAGVPARVGASLAARDLFSGDKNNLLIKSKI